MPFSYYESAGMLKSFTNEEKIVLYGIWRDPGIHGQNKQQFFGTTKCGKSLFQSDGETL